MPDMGAGTRIYKNSTAATSLTVTPQTPFSAIVHRVIIDKVSAASTWTVTTAGQEVFTVRIDTVGNQQLTSNVFATTLPSTDIFSFTRDILQDPLRLPIKQGESLVVSCDGSTTADISVEYEEGPASFATTYPYNGSDGRQFYVPMFFALGSAVSSAVETAPSTQYGLSFAPSIFKGGSLPAGWRITIVGFFLEAAGRNTYSGSADHQSTTNYLAILKNGQRLFTRDAAAGIPMVGTASATGSANTVYKWDYNPYPPFQWANERNWLPLDPPLLINPGDTFNPYIAITGDVTGNADYSHALQVALCKITETS